MSGAMPPPTPPARPPATTPSSPRETPTTAVIAATTAHAATTTAIVPPVLVSASRALDGLYRNGCTAGQEVYCPTGTDTPAASIAARTAAAVAGLLTMFIAAVDAGGDVERRPALRIGLVPDVDVGARLGQQRHHAGHVLVGGAVHGGLAVVVDGVQVAAELQRHLDRFEHLRLRAGILARRGGADAGRHHERAWVPSSFASSGSAPSSASSRIRSASPVRAASRNGVPPRKLRRVMPAGGRVVTRAFTSAPAATIFRTNSRLVMAPEPLGAGLLLAGDARLADPRDLVQRRPAARGDVDVGAAVDQQAGQLVVGVGRRQQKGVQARGRALGAGAAAARLLDDRERLFDVDSGLQQCLDDADTPFAHREEQRRPALR